MTAKEELRERLAGMSEEEAARLLAIAETGEDEEWLIPGELEKYPPEERAAALKEFFESWRDKGAYLSDEQWEEFARDFDAQRPHRPLFT